MTSKKVLVPKPIECDDKIEISQIKNDDWIVARSRNKKEIVGLLICHPDDQSEYALLDNEGDTFGKIGTSKIEVIQLNDEYDYEVIQ